MESTALVVFQGFHIRMARSKNGEPLVCLEDICTVLGIKRAREVATRLSEKGAVLISTLTAGGEQQKWFVTEAGMYEVLMGSRKPIARDLSAALATKMTELRQQSTAIVPLTSTTLMKEFARGMVAMADKLDEHDVRLKKLEKNEQAIAVITAPVKEISTRTKIVQIVRKYAENSQAEYKKCFDLLYYEFKLRYHIDLPCRTRNNGNKTILDTAEQLGCLDDLFSLAVLLFVGKAI